MILQFLLLVITAEKKKQTQNNKQRTTHHSIHKVTGILRGIILQNLTSEILKGPDFEKTSIFSLSAQ